MIVKMMKVSVVVNEARQTDTLVKLRELGVLHPEVEKVSNTRLAELAERRERVRGALIVLPAGFEIPVKKQPEQTKALALADEVLDLAARIRSLEEEREELLREEDRLAPWGDFDPSEIHEIGSRGVELRLYETTIDQFTALGGAYRAFVVGRTKTMVKFAVVLSAGETPPPLTEIPLPRRGLSEIRSLAASRAEEIAQLRREIDEHAVQRNLLTQAEAELSDQIEFETVKGGMGCDASLTYLSGYVPYDLVGTIEKAAERESWGLLVHDPDPDDPVPTLVRNPPWIRIIRPLFELLGTVPGYREFDISFLFLVFFSVFFAMIIGDAGYGFILLGGAVAAIAAQRRKGGKPAAGPILILVLSTATIIWGAMTGTWFGSRTLAELPFLRWMIIPQIYSFDPRSSSTIMFICFVLGTIHISIAHIWGFFDKVRHRPRLRALAQLGWLSLVLGVFYLVLSLVLDPVRYPLYPIILWMILGGILAVIFFANQEGKFLAGVAAGFANILPTFLSGIGAFSDIISYIRLFAVGFASVEVAKSFNTMAAGVGDGVVGVVGGIIILLIGHSLNLAMGALSVIVHGVRLNVLEFSGHLGMEWTGKPYAPFADRTVRDTVAVE